MRMIRILFTVLGIFLLPLLLLSCNRNLSAIERSKSDPVIVNAFTMSNDILYHVNEYRKKKGLGMLKGIAAADEQAALHSKNMALKRTAFGHDGFENRIQRITKSTGTIMAAAENVAYGKLSAEEVVKGWINSPGHRKNIEGNYTQTGIGVYQDAKGVIFFTQLFIRQ
ncbi:hypothetical protein KACHI17_07750 [Sediminibacterium sp. KACHI17]|uniref:SCP domain-containing protein n=2 Tax=Sediminibacterium sp. KACHI17 TaxID=1751071 RepID=A0AAT9GH40_9BACT